MVWGFRDGSPSVPIWMVRRLLEDAVHAACREVYRKAQEVSEMRGMGTTIVALLVAGDRGFAVHVGDSRAYLVREGCAFALTRDHSVLNDLVRSGEITQQKAQTEYANYRHSLSRAVGVCEDVEVDSTDFEILPGDLFLLCSDGLTHYLKDGEIGPLAAEVRGDLAAAFVSIANERGGQDNITSIVVRVDADEAEEASEATRAREFAAKIRAFQTMPLFRHLAYEELIRVLAATDVVGVRAGEPVQREPEDGDALFVVLSGRVTIDTGGERVDEYAAGTHFGEVSLVDRGPRTSSAVAVEDARLMRLRRESLYALVKREPEIAVKLLWSFSEAPAGRDAADASGGFQTVAGKSPFDAS